MTTNARADLQSVGTTNDARITINYTTDARGRTYVFHRCTRCGAEGTRRVDLAEHTCGGE